MRFSDMDRGEPNLLRATFADVLLSHWRLAGRWLCSILEGSEARDFDVNGVFRRILYNTIF